MVTLLVVGYGLLTAGLCGLAVTTLAWMLFAWRSAGSLADLTQPQQRHPPDEARERLSFSLLVPARHEEDVLAATLDLLVAIDYEDFEVIVIVGHDDPATAAIAKACAQAHPERIRVVVDNHAQKNKPRALNTALPYATGDIVGVFDAEDVVHPQLLNSVARVMATGACAAMQSGVQLMNYWSSWFAVRNVLEYYFWFRSRLHFQAERGFIPLGGNTVFVRRSVLELLGGWDGDCLAEDCDLGVRLSSHGFRIFVSYDPVLVTKEEVPATLGAFVRQRTRWNQGFLQVLFKGDWKMLARRRDRALALYTLSTPFVQSATGLLLPLAVITMVVGRIPAPLAMLSFLPLIPTFVTVAVEHLALQEFTQLYGVKARIRDHARLFFGTPVYQAVLSYSAIRAVIRHWRRKYAWDKTAHLGLHLREASTATPGETAEAAA